MSVIVDHVETLLFYLTDLWTVFYLFLALSVIYLSILRKKGIPKGYKKIDVDARYTRKPSVKIDRNRFSEKKIPNDIDVIA